MEAVTSLSLSYDFELEVKVLQRPQVPQGQWLKWEHKDKNQVLALLGKAPPLAFLLHLLPLHLGRKQH